MFCRIASRFVLPFSVVAVASLTGCGASGGRSGFDDANKDAASTDPGPSGAPTGDFGNQPPPPSKPAEVAEVFGHSPTTLFRLDPQTKAVAKVADFNGCTLVIDLALDEASNLYATSNPSGGSEGGLWKVDRATAKCTLVKTGKYPNSLSFVPKGTVDANAEALVGYNDDQYIRIDTTTGAITPIGSLASGDLISSGDIVAVKGSDDGKTPPKAFLTVKNSTHSGSCTTNDCLVEVDPKSGKVVKFWGNIEHNNVFGLAFWGGSVYGFDDAGELFEVTFSGAKLATATIPVPNKPAGLQFWGAGSSTAAPLVPTAK